MPRWQAILVAAGHMCGASVSRCLDADGQLVKRRAEHPGEVQLYCRQRPVPGQADSGGVRPYRCRFHGGNAKRGDASPAAGNQHNRRHGLYAKGFEGEDQQIYEALRADEAELHALRDEIAGTKVRLRRALILLREQNEALAAGRKVEELGRPLSYKKRRKAGGTGAGEIEVTEEKVLVDYERHVDRLIGQLARLLQTQAQLLNVAGASTPEDFAERARQLMAEMDERHPQAEGFE
jgi:hypothetical protein